jgi:hypothetical protein
MKGAQKQLEQLDGIFRMPVFDPVYRGGKFIGIIQNLGFHSKVLTPDDCIALIKMLQVTKKNHEYLKLIEEQDQRRTKEEMSKLRDVVPKTPTKLIPGFVYAIRDKATNYFKIGYSKNPKVRFAAILSTNPSVEYVFDVQADCCKTLEGEIHKKLADFRRSGEWFEITEEQAIEAFATVL